jgi:hypothetical protein
MVFLLVGLLTLAPPVSATPTANITPAGASGTLPGAATADTVPVEPAPAGVLSDLGHPIARRVLSPDQALGYGPNGEPQAYFVAAGNANTHAEFAAVDIRTGATVFDARLPDGESSSAVDYSAHDKAVYFGMSDPTGLLYRWRVGSSSVESLGRLAPGEAIWGIDAAPDGVVYAGTYPGGRLISYNPANGQVHDYGQVIAGETYVRGLEATDSTVWFGTQPNGDLGVLDRATGAITRIPIPEPYASWAGSTAYGIFQRGPRLFVRVTGSSNKGVLLIRDIARGTWVGTLPDAGTQAVSPVRPADRRTVYFRLANGHIGAYDIQSLTYTDTGWAPDASPGDFAWVGMADPGFPGLSLALTDFHGRIYVFNPVTRKTKFIQGAVQGAADPLTAITTGPDGRIYVGAFLSPPGMSRFTPSAGSFELLRSAGQVEGYGTWNSSLVYGRYPGGALLHFDPAQPWAYGTDPPPPVLIGQAQDRPRAFIQIGDRVLVGSVPATGELGGALSWWDPATGAVEVRRNVIPGQSPVSLALHDGQVYGGTSILGGAGATPVATDAVLFGWDPATAQVTFRVTPVPGASAVSALTFTPDGHLWGLAGTTLFEFDPTQRAVLRTKKLFPSGANPRDGAQENLRFVNGRLFGTAYGRFFHIDPVTLHLDVLASGAGFTRITSAAGDLYLVGGDTSVYRYRLPDDLTPPTLYAAAVRLPPLGTVAVLHAHDAGVGVLRIEDRIDDGPWQTYTHPLLIPFSACTLTYRATDRAFNASLPTTLTLHHPRCAGADDAPRKLSATTRPEPAPPPAWWSRQAIPPEGRRTL